MPFSTPEQCRLHAVALLELAQRAATPDARASLVKPAGHYQRCAERADAAKEREPG